MAGKLHGKEKREVEGGEMPVEMEGEHLKRNMRGRCYRK